MPMTLRPRKNSEDSLDQQVESQVQAMEQLRRENEELLVELQRLREERAAKLTDQVHSQVQPSASTSGKFKDVEQSCAQDWVDYDRLAMAMQNNAVFNTQPRTLMDESKFNTMLARQTGTKDLPSFSGDFLEWASFKTQFEESTNLFDLSFNENRLRLQQALKGPAREAVAPMLIFGKADAIPQIMEILERRFGQPMVVVESLADKVRRFPKMSDATVNAEDMYKFSAMIQNVLATLAGIDERYLDGPQLLQEIVSKLPVAHWSLWLAETTRNFNKKRRSVREFCEWYVDLCDNMSNSGIMSSRANNSSRRRENVLNVYDKDDKHTPRNNNNFNGGSKRNNESRHKCLFCKKFHKTVECREYLKLNVNDRWAWVKNEKLCFVCLSNNHRSKDCKEKKCNHCEKVHNVTLHHEKDVVVATVANTWRENYPVLLKVIPVILSGPSGQVKVYALLDDGSTISIIDEDIAHVIGAKGYNNKLQIQSVNGMHSSDERSRRVKLSIRGEDGPTYNIFCNTVKDLKLPEQIVIRKSEDMRNPMNPVRPKILLGQDNAHLVVARELREICGDPIIMSRTALGWTAHGGSRHEEIKSGVSNIFLINREKQDSDMTELIKGHFAIDSLGVTPAKRESSEEKKAFAIMEATTKPVAGGMWETGLLWKEQQSWLPDNHDIALKRFVSLEKKFKADPKLSITYKNKISEYISKGYAKPLSEEEAKKPSRRKWYLPHFAVFNPNKPGKMRVVFDAASTFRGTSLNDRLMTGPDMLSSLIGNILRFREGKVAIAADIKEMFLRIRIKEEDQKSQLFLWRENSDESIKTFQLASMMFGAKCSPASAQFVKNKVAETYEDEFPEAAEAIKNNFYMDDYLDAFASAREAIKLAKETTLILSRGGFQLVNWASNDPEVMKSIPLEARAEQSTIEIGRDNGSEKILGVQWVPSKDVFLFNFKQIKEIENWPTKRALLSAVMKIFDPLGFVGCLIIRSKIILQEVWRSKIDWDQKINEEHAIKWNLWIKAMNETIIEIPRCCRFDKKIKAELHMFCDASESACCVVAYILERIPNERPRVIFLGSKCKVAPLRPVSIPRLELQAALMAARFAKTIREQMNSSIDDIIYWTDSTTVLHWLRSDPRTYSSFVSNRLGEIDEISNIQSWRWVPTQLNPADIGTRDKEPLDLSPEGRWFTGPSFLKDSKRDWPVEKHCNKINDAELEVRRIFIGALSVKMIPEIERFSSWIKLIRSAAWVKRFVNACKRHRRNGVLEASELKDAETFLIKQSQNETFGEEISALKHNKMIPTTSRIANLSPELGDDGILRMSTRLMALSGSGDQLIRYPAVLDGNHPYTKLLIKHIHEVCGHLNAEKTIAEVRRDLVVLKIRSTTRRVVHECVMCKIRRSKVRPPMMGQLPAGRLAHHQKPFTHCGIDFFGPMEVTVGRHREKRYGVLFTCLTTRAVHLELTAKLDADSTIMAIRRMTARRGNPKVFHSDNGTNFHAADKEMSEAVKDVLQDENFKTDIAARLIEWEYIPPSSPHMGGAWERLVRSVKDALRKILKCRAPREETLLTALAEAEHTVNSRPLTHVAVDPDTEEPLTPNHFLIGTASGRPHLAFYRKEEDEVCLRKQWRIAQQLSDMFWRRWMKEYLPTLAQRKKWREKVKPIEIGDLVIIADSGLPRNMWPRGRITRVHKSADGQVRSAQVKTASGVYVRPAVKIIVLPINPEEPSSPRKGEERPHEGSVSDGY